MKPFYKFVQIILCCSILNLGGASSLERHALSPRTSFARDGKFVFQRSSFSPHLITLLAAGFIVMCSISCSKEDPYIVEPVDTEEVDTTGQDTSEVVDSLGMVEFYDHVVDLIDQHVGERINALGLPVSRVDCEGYAGALTHPDRAYTYDLGRLLLYTAQNQPLWRGQMGSVIETLVEEQDSQSFLWPLSFDDHGVAESDEFIGPSVVVARALLLWSDHSSATDPLEEGAMNLADHLLGHSDHKISTSAGHYLIRQDLSDLGSSASTEENARVVKLFLELYRYLSEEGSQSLADQYLSAAEEILLGLVELKNGGTIFPFGVNSSGEAIFDMYGMEGIDAQVLMIQVLQQYLDQVPESRQNPTILEEFSTLVDLMEWVRNTFKSESSTVELPDGGEKVIPVTYPKRIGVSEIWPEIMADIMIVEEGTFSNTEEYLGNLKSLMAMMEFNPYLPTLLALPSGYLEEPQWDYGGTMNKPYGSLVNLVILAEALELFDYTSESEVMGNIQDYFDASA